MVAVVYGPSMTARTGLRVPGWALVSAVAAPVSMIGEWILADSRQQSFDAVGEDPPTDHRDGRSHSGHEGPTGHPEASARSHRWTVHDSDHWGGVCIWRPTTSWCRSRLDDLRMSSVQALRGVLGRSRDRDSVGSGRLCESIAVGDDPVEILAGTVGDPPREVVGADPCALRSEGPSHLRTGRMLGARTW